ncbi:hypothetical protein BC835DRAFT_1306840 [Cytidiella melzeri]|nr:hypothetical protein BC835DRAFT_1306840 [Cytidiella melzeri]
MDNKRPSTDLEYNGERSPKRQRRSTPPRESNGNNGAHAHALPPLSCSILGVEPLDEFIREIADFVHHMIMTRSERVGNVEVEAKVGVLRNKGTGQRLVFPVLVETVLAPDALDTRFESNMSPTQHKHFNTLLNNLKTNSHQPDHPSPPLQYTHLHLVDSFYNAEGSREKIRVTRNEKTGEVVACMRKVRLGSLDIYSPKRMADWRISVNVEVPVAPPVGTATLTRRKDRLSYSHEEFTIDLTQVTSQGAPNTKPEVLHELELEFTRSEYLLATALRRGDPNVAEAERSAFDELMRAFVNNARILNVLPSLSKHGFVRVPTSGLVQVFWSSLPDALISLSTFESRLSTVRCRNVDVNATAPKHALLHVNFKADTDRLSPLTALRVSSRLTEPRDRIEHMSTTYDDTYDCIVVGSGHAGSCAALAASDAGLSRVLIIDKCPEGWVGGNGYFTAGAHRTVHNGLDDLLPIVHNVDVDIASEIDMDPYTAEDFTSDIMRLGGGRSDPALVKAVVDGSRDAIGWLAERVKMPFHLSFNRQAYLVNGRQKFWGGMVLSVQDGGKGVIKAHQEALKSAGVETWFETPAVELICANGGIVGLMVLRKGQLLRLTSPSVILACGGYEASVKLRGKYLGEDWKRAKVRGTPYNTGDGLAIASSIGAALKGDFRGCHSTCWDADAPSDGGDRALSNQFTKSGYPLGLMLNTRGVRFVDEGEDFRNYTYAKFGREILVQPGGFVFQVWDSRVVGWLRKEEYGDDVVRKMWAKTPEELAEKLEKEGLESKTQFIQTLTEYNEAVHAFAAENTARRWDPAVKDGLSTQSSRQSLAIPKTNWALPLEQPPYLAVKVSCGITFTFGGLAIDPETAVVLSESTNKPIPGLFCAGELVGGLFYSNYPGGSGLTAGAVLGIMAGREAAKRKGQTV